MTMNQGCHSHRRLDVASLILLLISVSFGAFSYWLVTSHQLNAAILIPSVVAATIGATHLTKLEASR